MDGTPARLEIFTSNMEESLLFLPYSSKYTPAATPSGKAIRVVKLKIQREPVHAVKIPAFSDFLEGKLFIKSQSIRANPSINILPINIAKTIRPKKVHTIPTYSNALSFILFIFELVILLSKFLSNPETNII